MDNSGIENIHSNFQAKWTPAPALSPSYNQNEQSDKSLTADFSKRIDQPENFDVVKALEEAENEHRLKKSDESIRQNELEQ